MGHRTSSVARAIWPIDGTILALGRSKNLGVQVDFLMKNVLLKFLLKFGVWAIAPACTPCSDGPVFLWPMYVFSWMHAVMHEKRFALHGHKSTDGLNVEEEILGKTTLL